MALEERATEGCVPREAGRLGVKASTRAHYSYSLYARPDVAQGFDTDRFGGPIGVMVAERQETVLLRMLGTEIAGKTFLDVGAGTGRASSRLRARVGWSRRRTLRRP